MAVRALSIVLLALALTSATPQLADIDALIARRVASHELPGAVLLIARHGRIETLRAFGDADVESQRPMRTDSLFRLASAAKIITTAALLTFVDDGSVTLDDDVATHLPEFSRLNVFTAAGAVRAATRPLMIRDLLRHTCGYGYGNDARQRAAYERARLMTTGADGDWSHPYDLASWSAKLATVPLTADPGTRFEYGLCTDLAGALIERVSAQPLDRVITRRILAPLGMSDTTFVVSPAQAPRLTSAYRVDGTRYVRVDDAAGPFLKRPTALSGGGGWTMTGGGGLVSSAPDVHRFLQMLLDGGARDGKRILSARSVDEIFVNQLGATTTPERVPGIGFGLGAAVVTDAARYGVERSEGLLFWSGSLNTRFWIDRARGLTGVYFSQVEPMQHLDLMNQVMKTSLRPELAVEDLDLHGVAASIATHLGRRAIRLVESDDTRSAGLALVKGLTLRDGTIEADVAGRRGPYARDDDRGFVGIAFRVSGDARRYEVIYLRPDNGRADDQLQRNHATQYMSMPDFPWQRLRKEFPGTYESYVDLESGAWTSVRIDIRAATARLFVHGANQPALIVNDLRLPPDEGGVALWIGAGSEAFFSNVRVTRR